MRFRSQTRESGGRRNIFIRLQIFSSDHWHIAIDNQGVRGSLIASVCAFPETCQLYGSGSMINIVDGKEVDFTPYMLKSLETVGMGLPEKSNN
nr:DUF1883 domain-containing protein [Salmonella enterica]